MAQKSVRRCCLLWYFLTNWNSHIYRCDISIQIVFGAAVVHSHSLQLKDWKYAPSCFVNQIFNRFFFLAKVLSQFVFHFTFQSISNFDAVCIVCIRTDCFSVVLRGETTTEQSCFTRLWCGMRLKSSLHCCVRGKDVSHRAGCWYSAPYECTCSSHSLEYWHKVYFDQGKDRLPNIQIENFFWKQKTLSSKKEEFRLSPICICFTFWMMVYCLISFVSLIWFPGFPSNKQRISGARCHCELRQSVAQGRDSR